MSQRPGFTVTRRIPTDGGVSPNEYVPYVTVEIRVHYPPTVAASNITPGIIEDAYREAQARYLELESRL